MAWSPGSQHVRLELGSEETLQQHLINSPCEEGGLAAVRIGLGGAGDRGLREGKEAARCCATE